MDGDVPYFDWYLNGNCGGKAWFAAIKVEGDKSSIGRFDCPHGRKERFPLGGTCLEDFQN
jgi:hypothetical protein